MAHKHAKLMMEYAKDAAEYDNPWEFWESRVTTLEWMTCKFSPTWRSDVEYRRKPRTININGIEVPEPVREALEDGEDYFIPVVSNIALYIGILWRGDKDDLRMFDSGLIHLTKEAAILHAKALLSFTQVEGE